MPDSQENNHIVFKCRNCGCDCTSRFCPDCGQSVDEKRLQNKSFFIGLVSGLSRINRGFLFTAWQLLIHPWCVIRDYIQCRRVRYVPPVSMLIIVCFISTFISGLLTSEPDGVVADSAVEHVSLIHHVLLTIADYLTNNMIARNLTVYIPALIAIPVVYWRVGAKKYNVAEYFAAMIYITTSFLIFGIIISPLSLLSEEWCSGLEFCYSIFLCSMSMFKAFPLGSMKKSVGYFMLYLIVSLLIYILIALGLLFLTVYK